MLRKLLNKHNIILTCIIAILTNCSSTNEDPKTSEDSSIRNKGVLNAAFTFGAQSGLAWQSKNISKICNQNSKELAKVYNFNAMLMKNSLLPPIIAEVKDSLRLTGNTIRLADKIVEIIAPARFVSTPPTWRDYIHMEFKFPEEPNSTLLPRTEIERTMWDKEIQQGWNAGVKQANNIFSQNLGRLNRDFSGIALYHAFYSQNMISSPQTASAKLGITGDKNRMRINDKLLRITAHADLQFDQSQKWHPALISDNHINSTNNYVARK